MTRLVLGEESGPWHTCALQVGYLAAAIDEDVVASATLLREGKQTEVDVTIGRYRESDEREKK